jgi:hypothetical protein
MVPRLTLDSRSRENTVFLDQRASPQSRLFAYSGIADIELGVAALRIDGIAGGACTCQGYGYAHFNGSENVYVPCEPLVKG